MKHRVIFVGVHNKPGKMPLDSSTLTGKTVDAIASGLEEFEIVKSNMHNLEYLPPIENRVFAISEWRKRVKYKRGNIVVALGAQVAWDFSRNHPSTIRIDYISIDHPAKRMSADDRLRYIQESIEFIKRKAK